MAFTRFGLRIHPQYLTEMICDYDGCRYCDHAEYLAIEERRSRIYRSKDGFFKGCPKRRWGISDELGTLVETGLEKRLAAGVLEDYLRERFEGVWLGANQPEEVRLGGN